MSPKKIFWVFVVFSANVCFAQNIEFGSQSGILLHWEDNRMYFLDGGVKYDNRKNFSNDLNLLKIGSDMPWFSTDIIRVDYSAKFDFGAVSPNIKAAFLKQSQIEILLTDSEKKRKITNEGAQGFYLGSALGVEIRDIKITPSVLFGKGKFEKGDFNYFYGKPNIPFFWHIGLSAEYEEAHKINFSYQKFGVDILNNKEMPLFYSDIFIFGVNYKYSFLIPQKPHSFYGILGLNYVDFSATGSLNPANQQYFLFPYAFFNIEGSADAFVVWTAFSSEFQRKYLTHSLKIGAGNIFGEEINADIHFKYRKFFGDDETEIDETLNLKNTGLAFFLYSLESPSLKIRNRAGLRLGLQKIFAGPWGLGKFMDYIRIREDTDIYENTAESLLKTILLSGLSGYLRVEF